MSGTNARPKTIGPYQRLEPLGVGGMGVVYRAVHGGTGQAVALKTVRVPQQEMLKSLRREIHALARIRHPDIVRILDEGLEDGMPWYAMELLEGVPLRHYCAGPEAGAPTPTLATVRAADLWWTHSLAAGTGAGAADSDGSPDRAAPLPPLGRPPAGGPILDRGADLRTILTLIRRLCAPLSFLHGEGIVHRDLKPENVLVRPDGHPVLVDFGLAARFAGAASREFLEVESGASGTLAYIAPEALYGEAVDARADLYSLGCIFYELLTGRRPFVAAKASELIRAQLHAVPVPPSQLVADLPAGLDDLVLRFLAKSPRQRLGYADDVAAALGALGAEDGPRGPRPRPYLYRPELAGREEPLRALEAWLEELEAGTGGLLLLGGESGVGKTRLVMELGRRAERRSVRVLAGECLAPVLSGEPRAANGGPSEPATEDRPEPAALAALDSTLADSLLQPLRRPLQALADRCRSFGEEETRRLLGRHGKLLSLYEPAFAGLPGQTAEAQDVVPLPPEAALMRLYTVLTQSFAALAEDRPLLLLLDDLQWADELTLGFLGHLARSAEANEGSGSGRWPILLLGTFRSEEVGARGRPALRKLLEAPGVVHLRLGRLDEPAVGAVVGDMLALAPPPAAFVSFLSRHSEGNPFFVAEYLRMAIAEGVLFRSDGQWQVARQVTGAATEDLYEALPLPHSLRETVERRLGGLSGEAQHLAEAASVLGRETDESLLLAMVRDQDGQSLEAIDELRVHEILEEAGAGRLHFVHDKIREVAYERTGPEPRRMLHRAAAQAIVEAQQTRRFEARDEVLATLGHHWEQAGVPEKARDCYLAAARRAAESYAHEEAERLYRAHLRLVEAPTQESVEARNELGDRVLFLRGRSAEALEEHRVAVEEARRIGDRHLEAEGLRSMGIVCNGTGRMDLAKDLLEQAVKIAREVRDRRLEGVVLGNLASVHEKQGHVEEAQKLFEQAVAIDREVGNRGFEGVTLGNLAAMHFGQGRLEQARQIYEQAIDIHREVGNRRFEGIVLGNLAALHREQGRLEQSRQFHEQAMAIHREVGNRSSEGITLGNLAEVYFAQGKLEKAQHLYRQALAIAREVGHRRFEGSVLGNLGRLERFATGDLATATALSEQGEELLRAAGDRLELGKLLCGLGHIQLAHGRSGRQFLERAQALVEGVGAGPGSPAEKLTRELRHAVEAFEAGEQHRLFRGEFWEDLPEGLRRWLIETGQAGEAFAGSEAGASGRPPERLRARPAPGPS